MIVVIGASAGGIPALTTILNALPSDFPAPIVIVQHRSLSKEWLLAAVLARRTSLRVREAETGGALEPGTVYIAKPSRHLTVTVDRRFEYSDGHRIRHLLSSANPLFASAAAAFGHGAIAVVLSGSGSDGTDGVQEVKSQGGVVIAQDEATAEHFGMPGSAIETGVVDYVLPIQEIAPALLRLVGVRSAMNG